MPSIAIVTDTDSSLPVALAERYGIRQVPITVHFGAEVFRTNLDIDDARLFERVDRAGKLPTTAAPAPGQFVEAFEAAFKAGADQVLCFAVSSEVSATYNAACTARDLLPDRDIAVIDTCTVSLPQGFMVLAAAEAVRLGSSRDQALARAQETGGRTRVYAALSTLKYLAMSGRVGFLAAGLGNVLNVKPILTVRGGKLDMLERVRTQSRAWARVIELTREGLAGREIERAGIIHANAPIQAAAFEEQVRAALECPAEIVRAEFTAGLSVHTGAGMLGLAVVAAA